MKDSEIGLYDALSVLMRCNKIIFESHKGLAVLSLVSLFLTAIMPFVILGFYSYAIDSLSGGLVITFSSALFFGLLLALFSLDNFMQKISRYYAFSLSESINAIIAYQLLDKILSLDIATHEDTGFKNDLSHVSSQGMYVVYHLIEDQFKMLIGVVRILFAAIVIATVTPIGTAFIFLGFFPATFITYRFAQYHYWEIRKAMKINRRRSRILSWIQHGDYIPEIKIFNSSRNILKKYKDYFDKSVKIELDVSRNDLWGGLSVEMIYFIVSFLAIFLVLYGYHGSIVSVGEVVFSLGLIGKLISSVSEVSQAYGTATGRIHYARMLFSILDRAPSEYLLQGSVKLDSGPPAIVFDGVSFSYPGSRDEILHDLNFRIEPGEKVAIVGENGAGKTTLTKLLCGFYSPSSGRILLNDTSMTDVSIRSWHDKLSVLFQNFMQPRSLTVSEKIQLAKPHVKFNKRAANAAAKKASALSVIQSLEGGYDSVLGKDFDGIELSGGEWQKLALTKAHYKDPDVIILDEPTAAMDPKAEAEVFSEIHSLGSDTTVIFISHRLTTILEADKIIYLSGGFISGTGTHDDLLSSNKKYRAFFSKQIKKISSL